MKCRPFIPELVVSSRPWMISLAWVAWIEERRTAFFGTSGLERRSDSGVSEFRGPRGLKQASQKFMRF